MASNIDPTVPIDGTPPVPAVKADLRANLLAAKNEIEALQAGTGLANDSVALAKIQNAAASSKLLGSGSAGAGANYTEISLDSTLTMTGTTLGAVPGTIADNSITDAKLRDSGPLSVIGRTGNTTDNPGDISAVAASGAVLRESGSGLTFGTVATAGIADDAVTLAKLQNALASSKLIGSGATGAGANYTEITLGTNLTMTGTTLDAASGTVADNSITLAKLQNAVASSKLLGSGASGAGIDYAELTLGTNLSMSGTTLNATGGGSIVVQDDGVQEVATATTFNFSGDGVSVTPSGNTATVVIPGTSTGTFTHPAMGALVASVGDTVGGMAVNVKTAFGAVGDGFTDDRAALQAAIDSNWPLYFPPGSYLISDSLTYAGQVLAMRGSAGKYLTKTYAPTDAVWGTPSGSTVTITSVLGGLPIAEPGAKFVVASHTVSANNGTYRVVTQSTANSLTAFKYVAPAPVAAVADPSITMEVHFKYSRIIGNFAKPLLYRNGIYVDHTNAVIGSTAQGTGCSLIIEDMNFDNDHAQGSAIQTYNVSAPTSFNRCSFGIKFRGLMILSGFDVVVSNCIFTGDTADVIAYINAGTEHDAIGLAIGQHTTVTGCTFQRCGTGIFAFGQENSIIGCRTEACGIGIRCGGPSLDPNKIGQSGRFGLSRITSVWVEACNKGMWVYDIGPAVTISNISVYSTTGGPLGIGQYGIHVDFATGNTNTITDVTSGGRFTQASFIASGAMPKLSGVIIENDEALLPDSGSMNMMFSKPPSSTVTYALNNTSFNPTVNTASDLKTVTAYHDLHLRGLKGLNIRDPNVLPNNLGGLVTVTEAATTTAVVFQAAVTAGQTQFVSTPPVVADDPTSTLAAGTYYYAITAITQRGETGIGSPIANGVATAGPYKTVVVSSTLKSVTIDYAFLAGVQHRLYRGSAVGFFTGYWALPDTPSIFTDNGTTAFTGRDMPPPDGYAVPSQAEPDANYAVVVTPGWATAAYVTLKLTTGFTINFVTGPSVDDVNNGRNTVQWLLFRP